MSVEIPASETLAVVNVRAKTAFDSNRWQAAETLYVELLNRFADGELPATDEDVSLCEVLNQLGICAIRQNRLEDAIQCFQNAIQQAPKDWRAFVNIGQIFKVLGKLQDALCFFKQAVELAPDQITPVNTFITAIEDLDKKVDYLPQLRTVLYHQPNHPEAIRHTVAALMQVSKQSGGKAHLKCDNQAATEHYQTGLRYHEQQAYDKAEDAYLQSIQLCPERAETYFKLGETYYFQGKYTAAIACMRTTAKYVPDDPAPLTCIGFYLIKADRYDEAIPAFEKAYTLDPTSHTIPLHLGYIHTRNKAPLTLTKKYLLQALANGGRQLFLFQLLGKTLCELGEVEQAIQILDQAYAELGDPLLKIQSLMALPSIYTSNDMIETCSKHYRDGLQQFRVTTEVREPFATVKITPPFQIPYMGKNDREAQRRLCEVYCAVYPQLNWIAPHCQGGSHPQPSKASGKIKIGFISSYFKNHTIGHLNLGLVQDFDREKFEVVVIRQPQVDDKTVLYDQAADKTIVIEGSLENLRKRIAAEKLDVLYYTDIGMEPTTYMLSMSRLAHVQTQTWGQPETSGSPHMDYFLSSQDLDIATAQDHYCEALVRFEKLNCYYRRPEDVALPQRTEFGWTNDEHIYLCPQSLFKFFPDFDAIMGEILRRDPIGKVVLLEGAYPEWNEILEQRFASKYPAEAERLIFHPRLSRENYTRINAAADVVIEPIHFGNGNSSYEAFSVNALVVSMPSDFLRCRITYSQLKKMGVEELIVHSPEEYVELALKLAHDKTYARQLRAKIAQRKERLYDDKDVLHALEDFLVSAVEKTWTV